MTARLTEDEIAALAELEGEGHDPPTVADPSRGAVTVDPSRTVEGRPRRELTLPVREIEGSRSAPRESDTVADVMESRRRKGMPARPDEMPTAVDAFIGSLATPTSEARSPESRRAASDVARARRGLMGDIDETLGLSRRAGELPDQLRSVPIIGDSLGDWVESGTAGASGSAQGATIGFGDELAGAAGYIHGGGDPRAYTRERDRVRETNRRDREASPNAYFAGELTGALATAPLTPTLSAGRGAGLASRLGTRALEGAAYGGLAGAGASEATGGDLAVDAAEGAAGGALFGAAAGALGEAGSALGRGMRRTADSADRLRVVAPAGGNAVAADELLSLPGAGAPGSPERTRSIAERMRRIGLGGVATSEEMAARAARARDTAGSEIAATRGVLEGGPPIPTSALTGAMERHAAELGRTSSGVPFADTVRARIPRVAEAMGGAESVPYSRAMEELEGIGREANWTNRAGVEVRPSTEARRGLYGAVRGAMDDFARPTLGDEGLEAYRRSRHDYATSLAAREAAEAASTRTARNRGMSPTDYAVALGAGGAGYAGGGATGGLGAAATGLGLAAAHRAARLREPTLRATGAEAVRALLESRGARVLGEYGPAMMQALERGGEAFAGRHAALMRSDPEYATAVESAMAVEEATTEPPRTARELFEAGLETEEPPRRTARELFEAGLE